MKFNDFQAFCLFMLLLLFMALCLNNCTVASLIDAIAIVESNFNYSAVGDNGKALGAWQFHRAAWEDVRRVHPVVGQHCINTFGTTNAAAQRLAAETYLAILRKRLAGAGVASPTPAQLLCCWQMGFTGFRRIGFNAHRAPATTQRAIRKLHNELKK